MCIVYLYVSLPQKQKQIDMKKLQVIDLTKDGEDKYTTYFYHKNLDTVYKVITNGSSCVAGTRKDLGFDRNINHGSTIPNYIQKKLS